MSSQGSTESPGEYIPRGNAGCNGKRRGRENVPPWLCTEIWGRSNRVWPLQHHALLVRYVNLQATELLLILWVQFDTSVRFRIPKQWLKQGYRYIASTPESDLQTEEEKEMKKRLTSLATQISELDKKMIAEKYQGTIIIDLMTDSFCTEAKHTYIQLSAWS